MPSSFFDRHELYERSSFHRLRGHLPRQTLDSRKRMLKKRGGDSSRRLNPETLSDPCSYASYILARLNAAYEKSVADGYQIAVRKEKQTSHFVAVGPEPVLTNDRFHS